MSLHLPNMFPTAINGKTPFSPILMHFAARFAGKTYGQFASDYRVLVDANLRCMEHFATDTVSLISDPYRETAAFGAPIKFIDEGVPQCLSYIIKSTDDVRNLPIPDVYKNERTLDRINGAALFTKSLQGKTPIIGWIEGPLAEACDLAGIDTMMLQLMMDPDFTHALLDKCVALAKQFAKAQIEAGCSIIGMGDAICSQIDVETYNTYVRDRHREIADFIHSLGARLKLHICGDIRHLLPSIAMVGVDILDCDWQVDLRQAIAQLGNGVILSGNINPVAVQNETPETIRQMADSIIRQVPGGRLILSGGCEITVLTPTDNLLALTKACQ